MTPQRMPRDGGEKDHGDWLENLTERVEQSENRLRRLEAPYGEVEDRPRLRIPVYRNGRVIDHVSVGEMVAAPEFQKAMPPEPEDRLRKANTDLRSTNQILRDQNRDRATRVDRLEADNAWLQSKVEELRDRNDRLWQRNEKQAAQIQALEAERETE